MKELLTNEEIDSLLAMFRAESGAEVPRDESAELACGAPSAVETSPAAVSVTMSWPAPPWITSTPVVFTRSPPSPSVSTS